MKRFRFPLRPVAVMRAHRELRAREALAAAIATCTQAEERVAATRARIADLNAVIQASRRGSTRAAEASAFAQAFRREWVGEMDAQKQLAAARTVMEKRRGECIEANRDLQVITRLEEKARTAHQQEGQRAEQGEIDEMAGQRAARNRLFFL